MDVRLDGLDGAIGRRNVRRAHEVVGLARVFDPAPEVSFGIGRNGFGQRLDAAAPRVAADHDVVDAEVIERVFDRGADRIVIGARRRNRIGDIADFEQLAANYYQRQDLVVKEDNDISQTQQLGLRSPLTRPGRFAPKEKIVHALDNWVLDRVLAAENAAASAVTG